MDVAVENLQPVAVASVRRTTTESELPSIFDSSSRAILTALGEARRQPKGHMFARYHHFEPQHVDVEIGLPVDGFAQPVGDVAPSSLPGGEVASVLHVGPYPGLGSAYDALYAWARENNVTEPGAPWEVYLNTPLDQPDQSKLETKVYLPLG